MRVIPHHIGTFEELNLPPVLGNIVKAPNGLILVCGPTGNGATVYRMDAALLHDAPMPGAGVAPMLAPLPVGPQAEQSFDLDRPLREARDSFEKSYFEFHLAKENGSMTRVAEKTGLERTHLYRKLKQLGVKVSRREQ